MIQTRLYSGKLKWGNNVATENIHGIREQLRGTLVPKKDTFGAAVEKLYAKNVPDVEPSPQARWVENDRNRALPERRIEAIFFEGRISRKAYGVCSTRFSPSGEKVVIGCGDGTIQVLNLRNNDQDQLTTLIKAIKQKFPIWCVRFVPKTQDAFFATSSGGSIYLCDLEKGTYINFAEEPKNETNSVDVDPSGTIAVTGGKDAAVRVYDINTRTVVNTYSSTIYDLCTNTNFHVMRINAVKFRDCGADTFLTGGWDNYVKLWDVRDEKGCVLTIRGPCIFGDTIDARGSMLLTGSWTAKNSIQLWNLRVGKLIESLRPINRPVITDSEFTTTAQFHANDQVGNVVVSGGSRLGYVEVANVKEQRVVARYKVQKGVRAIDTTKNYVAIGGIGDLYKIVAFTP